MSELTERLLVRCAQAHDLDAIADLQACSIMALGVDTYGLEACEAWATMGRQVRHRLLDTGRFFVAEIGSALVGVAGWTEDSRETDCAWVRYVFVEPGHAGRGVGRRLMATVERSADAAGRARLQLWASLNAVGFYERLGYRAMTPARWPVGGGVEMEHLLMEKVLVGAGDG